MTETGEQTSVESMSAVGAGGGATRALQHAVQLQFGTGVNQVTGQVSAPPHQGMVIETVTADIGVGSGEQAFLFVETTADGVSAQHTIALNRLPLMPEVFVATHHVQLYADAGSTVKITVTRWGYTPYPAIPKPNLVTLSGRVA
jgi:hypothetical protein